MAPLRRRWASIKAEAEQAVAGAQSGKTGARKLQRTLRTLLLGFVDELSHIRVLDPACGSGNFLYVALKQLLDLWKEVSVFGSIHGLPGMLPYQVGPSQLFGIEKNVYAHELASVVAWIGYIQWLHDNGFGVPPTPILKRLDNVRRMDSILSIDEEGRSYKPDWPDADVIIGNPPFLGGNKVRQELGDDYVERLFALYQGEVAPFADLVCYWFERARSQIEANRCKRAGLLATQGIRGGANRRVLERIKQSGDIFWAVSDRNWYLDGAMVHVSMLGFDGGDQNERTLDGLPVATINADLTSATDVTLASPLKENEKLCFMGPSAKGPFDIDGATASYMLGSPVNVNGRPNSDVVRKVFSGVDLVQHWRGMWTVDFALMSQTEAAQYERPFEYVRQHVLPIRSTNRRKAYAERWWLYAEPRPTLRRLVRGKSRIISTPAVAKHRIFVWVSQDILCNQGTLVFARDDDYFFGVLQSRIHEIWSRRSGTQVREAESGFRYTPTTTFETFPLPWPPGTEPQSEPRVESIAAAARDLVTKRDAWLNPPNAPIGDLAQRTLTRLYNQRPQWLLDAHNALDNAALAAYDWPPDLSDDHILAHLLELNRQRRQIENEGLVSLGCQ